MTCSYFIINTVATGGLATQRANATIVNALVLFSQNSPVSALEGLTHFPLDKMAVILQTIFSDVFLWMKILYFD